MEMMFSDVAQQYKAFIDEQKDIDGVIVIDNPYAGRLETSIPSMIQHVVNQGTYHRGNVTAMLRQIGHATTMTDFVLYLHSKSKLDI